MNETVIENNKQFELSLQGLIQLSKWLQPNLILTAQAFF